MDDVLDEIVAAEDLKKFERIYHEQLYAQNVSTDAQFNYAWCLVRSKYPADIRKGIILLEELFTNDVGEGRRDYLYYLAIGNARIKNYNQSLDYCTKFLNLEPANQQVQMLETSIKKRMKKDGVMGMALVGTMVLAVAGVVGFGLALTKGKG